MSDEMRPARMWRNLPNDMRVVAATAFWTDDQAALEQAEGVALIARQIKFRPKSVLALPVEKKAKHLAAMGQVSDLLAARLLVSYHLQHQRPMMSRFLDVLGISHDNGLIAAGLARYGRHEEAGRIAVAMFKAADYFNHRLPEVFAGYPRSLTRFPVEYPTACSPQAWAAGTPLPLLRVLLGLQPTQTGLISKPNIPDRIGSLGLAGVPGRWGRTDIATVSP